ncbi:MAG: hypothetical protein AAFT19_07215 [Pseudomonadota bacterium]
MRKVGNKSYPDNIYKMLRHPIGAELRRFLLKHNGAPPEFYDFLVEATSGFDPQRLYTQYLAPGAPAELNIQGKTREIAIDLANAGDWTSELWVGPIKNSMDEQVSLITGNFFSGTNNFWKSEIFQEFHRANGGSVTDEPVAAADDYGPGEVRAARIGFQDAAMLDQYIKAYEKHGSIKTAAIAKKLIQKEGKNWSVPEFEKILKAQDMIEIPRLNNIEMIARRVFNTSNIALIDKFITHMNQKNWRGNVFHAIQMVLDKIGSRGDPGVVFERMKKEGYIETDVTIKEEGGQDNKKLYNAARAADVFKINDANALDQLFKYHRTKGGALSIGLAEKLLKNERKTWSPGDFLNKLAQGGFIRNYPDVDKRDHDELEDVKDKRDWLGTRYADKLMSCGIVGFKDKVQLERINRLVFLLKAADKTLRTHEKDKHEKSAKDLYRQIQAKEPKDSAVRKVDYKTTAKKLREKFKNVA